VLHADSLVPEAAVPVSRLKGAGGVSVGLCGVLLGIASWLSASCLIFLLTGNRIFVLLVGAVPDGYQNGNTARTNITSEPDLTLRTVQEQNYPPISVLRSSHKAVSTEEVVYYRVR